MVLLAWLHVELWLWKGYQRLPEREPCRRFGLAALRPRRFAPRCSRGYVR
jgi:hypothetical protein